MNDERADDQAVREAMAQEVLNAIQASREAAERRAMYEPWGGHFTKKRPVLALSATGEA